MGLYLKLQTQRNSNVAQVVGRAMTSSIAFQAFTRIQTRDRISLFLFESTPGPGFRKVHFRAQDPPDPSGWSAQMHKTYAVSPKNLLRVDRASVSQQEKLRARFKYCWLWVALKELSFPF